MSRRDYTYGSAGDCTITFDNESPEGRIVAPTGSMHLDLNSATIYLKVTGVEDTGWVAVAGGGGTLPDGDYGDVTISGGGTLITINDEVITLDKLQDIPSGYVLGRTSPGTGDVELIPISSLGGGGSPGGADTNVQYNDGGAFGGDALFTFDEATDIVRMKQLNIWDGTNELGQIHTTNFSNLFVGHNAGSASNTLPAASASDPGSSNIGIGYYALSAVGDVGQSNTAVGSVALGSVSTGSYNFGMGFTAGNGITTGSGNILIGAAAGDNCLAGLVNSIGIGAGALSAAQASYNLAIGAETLGGVLGSQNIAIGYYSGRNVSDGSANVCLGYGAGYSVDSKPHLIDGDQNILLGMFTTPTVDNAVGEFIIGSTYQSIVDMYLGKGAINEAPVTTTINATGGFGTDIAGADLQIAGGRGTGTGVGGDIRFLTAPATTTGSTRNPLVEALVIDGDTGIADFAVAPTVGGAPISAGGGVVSYGAKVRRTTSQSIPSATDTAVIFDTEDNDDSAYWTVSQPSRFTIPSTGWYIITGKVQWDTGTNANGRNLWITKSGTTVLASSTDYRATETNARLVISSVEYLLATEYVELIVRQGEVGANSIIATALGNHPTFAIHRLGSTGATGATGPAGPAGANDGAQVHRAATVQSLTSGASTAVTFDTEDYDNGGYATLGTNNDRFTITNTGWYIVSGNVQIASSSSAMNRLWFSISGGTDLYGYISIPPVSGVSPNVASSAILYLTTGQYVQMIINQNGGSSANLTLTQGYPRFSIHRLGSSVGATGAQGPTGPSGDNTVTRYATSDQAKTSDTVLADDAVLYATLAANSKYRIEFDVYFDSSVTPDLKYDLNFTGTTTSVMVRSCNGGSVTTASLGAGVSASTFAMHAASALNVVRTFAIGGTETVAINIVATIEVGASGGVFSLRWAQGTTSGSATTRRRNSCMTVKDCT